MKSKVLKSVALGLLLLLIVSCFSACTRIKGTYVRNDDSEYYEAYEFFYFGDKMIYTYMVEDFSLEGSYEISKEEDKIYITIIGERTEHTYSKDGKTIYIDGIPYVKSK